MSDTLFATIAKLRAQYPDAEDLKEIERDEAEVKQLLEGKDYAALPETQRLLTLCRETIVATRLRLSTDRTLTEMQRLELFATIDARLWFVRLVARDYDAELARIEDTLNARLYE